MKKKIFFKNKNKYPKKLKKTPIHCLKFTSVHFHFSSIKYFSLVILFVFFNIIWGGKSDKESKFSKNNTTICNRKPVFHVPGKFSSKFCM